MKTNKPSNTHTYLTDILIRDIMLSIGPKGATLTYFNVKLWDIYKQQTKETQPCQNK